MPQIAIIGEAWGAEEAAQQRPFVGYAGQELNRMLREAGINRADCFLTNVFNLKPPSNKVGALCGPKSQSIPGYPPLKPKEGFGPYVRAEFIPELERLGEEICQCNPNIIIALGNTPMWALLGKTAISKLRGVTQLSTLTATGYKVLPTYHPSYIIRGAWADRPTVVMDLVKGLRESAYADIRRPKREIWIEPTLDDLEEFYENYIRNCSVLSVDIETNGDLITCIGFAPSASIALVIPFYDRRTNTRSYWPDSQSERQAWRFVERVLALPCRKLFQNGMYDIAFIWRSTGIKTMNAEEDVMLMHHALYPESLKSLGFLGSIYTDEGPWKQMRERTTTIKRDE